MTHQKSFNRKSSKNLFKKSRTRIRYFFEIEPFGTVTMRLRNLAKINAFERIWIEVIFDYRWFNRFLVNSSIWSKGLHSKISEFFSNSQIFSKIYRGPKVTENSHDVSLAKCLRVDFNFGWLISKEFVPNIKRFLPPSYLSNETIQN